MSRIVFAPAVVVLVIMSTLYVPTEAQPLSAPSSGGVPSYEEVSEAAGLGDYLHAGYLGAGNWGASDALFPDIMGPGACWLDADGDGDLDLYVVNSRYLTQPERNVRDPHNILYHNDGGHFTAQAVGAELRGVHMGCSAADMDNDGDPDLYVTGYAGDTLLRNDAGTFTDITDASGLRAANCGAFPCWSSSAIWMDADRDACLDLYVGHFGDYDLENPPQGNGPEYAPGQRNAYFVGNCDGTFTEATDTAGLGAQRSNTWAAVSADLNGDGWPDLYVANDGDANDLYENNGDGTFTRRAASVASDPRHGMGAAAADVNGDGRIDLAVSNFVNEYNGILRGIGDDYEDIGHEGGLADSHPWSGWALHWLDANRDGHLDLMVVNGMTEVLPEFHIEEPVQLYLANGDDTFRQASHLAGQDFQQPLVGRGAAWADYDDDGDVDVLVGQAGERPLRLLEAQRTPGHFLSIALEGGPGMNRDAVGAHVTVSAPGLPDQTLVRSGGSGFLSSNDPRLHFGTTAQSVDVAITWPDGTQEAWSNIRANSFIRALPGTLEVLEELPFVSIDAPDHIKRLQDLELEAHLSDGTATAVTWDLDGVTADGARATHAFDDVGTFTVYATITDELGRKHTASHDVHVWDDVASRIVLRSETFAPNENPRGDVIVTFSNGDPVAGANVRVVAQAFLPEPMEGVAASLPFFAQELLGRTPVTTAGVTDASGSMAFAVPHTFQVNSAAGQVGASHPGEYRIISDGVFRGLAVDSDQAEYVVLTPPMEP